MANPHRGEVSFDADGTLYTLHFSTNAFCELEAEMGVGLMQIAALLDKPEKLSMQNLRLLFWAGLRDRHPDISLTDAGRIMDAFGMLDAIQLAAKAFEAAFPAPQVAGPLGGNRKARRAATTGKRS